MVWILEGPDGTGKTTLANSLAETLPAIYIHNTARHDNVTYKLFDFYFNQVKYMCANPKTNFVLDRCWISDHIYGRILRDGPAINYTMCKTLLERLCKNHIVYLVFCESTEVPRDVIQDSFEIEHNIYSNEIYPKLVAEYNEYKRERFPCFVLTSSPREMR